MGLPDFVKKVEIVLTKRGLDTPPPTRVCLAVDVSGSMAGLYSNGTVQRVVDRLLAVAAKFDDDGSLDVFTFDTRSHECKPATAALFNGYVQQEILGTNGPKWGGTSYAPVIKDVTNKFFAKKIFGGRQGGLPAFVIFITDGENDDKQNAIAALKDSESVDIYWQMVGIGGAAFTFIRHVADTMGNVGFMDIRDVATIPDEQLYEGLVNEEFAAWIKDRQQKAA